MPNTESDIEPRRYSGKKHGLKHEQDGEDDEATAAWYILAVRFGPDLRNVLLEQRRSTRNDDWLQRESGILDWVLWLKVNTRVVVLVICADLAL